MFSFTCYQQQLDDKRQEKGMLRNLFQEQLEDCPVIAAARNLEGLAHCCQSESGIVFILFGDVCNISEIADLENWHLCIWIW